VTPDLCLDVKGTPGTTNGAPLQLSKCEVSGFDDLGNVTDQAWDFYYGGHIKNRLSGKCIDVAGAPGNSNHLPIQLWTCESSGYNPDNGSLTDQKWTNACSGANGCGWIYARGRVGGAAF
jgi:hypothetical protein